MRAHNARNAGRKQTGFYKFLSQPKIYRTDIKFEGRYSIYGLASSDDPDHVQYIGFTKNRLNRRYNCHIATASKNKNAKQQWVSKLRKEEKDLIMILIHDGISSREEAWKLEEKYIKFYKEKGFELMNRTLGGKGTYGRVVSIETRQKQSIAMKGKKCHPGTGTAKKLIHNCHLFKESNYKVIYF